MNEIPDQHGVGIDVDYVPFEHIRVAVAMPVVSESSARWAKPVSGIKEQGRRMTSNSANAPFQDALRWNRRGQTIARCRAMHDRAEDVPFPIEGQTHIRADSRKRLSAGDAP